MWGEGSTFTLSGQAAALKRAARVSAEGGSYSVDGNAATLDPGNVAPLVDFPQYHVEDYDNTWTGSVSGVIGDDQRSVLGATAHYLSYEMRLEWEGFKRNWSSSGGANPAGSNWFLGDWVGVDASGVEIRWPDSTMQEPYVQGTTPGTPVPFGQRTFTTADALNTYHAINITPLIQRWMANGRNRGIYIHPHSGSLSARLDIGGSRRVDASNNPLAPRLVITTTTGTFVLDDCNVSGWVHTSSRLTGIGTSTDSRQTARVQRNWCVIVNWFEFFETVTGTVTNAELQLYVLSISGSPLIKIYEIDYPTIRVGGEGGTVELGLSNAAGGDANLVAGQNGVLQVGDMVHSNLFTFTDSLGDYGAENTTGRVPVLGLFNQSRNASLLNFPHEYGTDPETGIKYLRTGFSSNPDQTNVSGDPYSASAGFRCNFVSADTSITSSPTGKFPAKVSERITELYARIYAYIEDDFLTKRDGIKWGMGMDLRCGWWNGTGWTSVSGSGQTPGTGLKVLGDGVAVSSGGNGYPAGYAVYEGHSLRGDQVDPTPWNSPVQDFRMMQYNISHNGPYEDATPNGSEEHIRMGTAMFKKSRWHCHEIRVKLNTLDGVPTAAVSRTGQIVPIEMGNQGANADGIFTYWIDGVKVYERTDIQWARHPEFSINGAWLQATHGGTAGPYYPDILHFRWAKWVVATQYIGPDPTINLSGSDRPYALPAAGAAKIISLNQPHEIKPTTWADSRWHYTCFESENALVYNPKFSSSGAIMQAGSGGHNHPDYTGEFGFDLSTGRWFRNANTNGIPEDYPFTTYPSADPGDFPEAFDLPEHIDLGSSIPVTGSGSEEHPYEVHYNGVQTEVPAPGHPFFSQAYSPDGAKGSIIWPNRTGVGAQSRPTLWGHTWDCSTRSWSRTTAMKLPFQYGVEDDTIWDEARNRWYIVSTQGQHALRHIRYFDRATQTWGTTSPQMSTFPSSTISLTWSAPNDTGGTSPQNPRTVFDGTWFIRNCGPNGIWVYSLDEPTIPWQQVTVSGTVPDRGLNRWARYSDGHWYTFNGSTSSNTITRIRVPADKRNGTWVVESVTLTGDALPERRGLNTVAGGCNDHYGRFMYAPSIDCLVWLPGGYASVVAIKPPPP